MQSDEAREVDSRLKSMEQDFSGDIQTASSEASIESVRIKFLGRKGLLASIMASLPSVPQEDRAKVGQLANAVKTRCQELFEKRKSEIKNAEQSASFADFDPTMPGRAFWQGSLHPVTLITAEICGIFTRLGFDIAEGPEVEIDRFNFEYLNMPPDHPARDMQDTLYITEDILMRTHTSPVQVRTMLKTSPPVAVIAPGKVYRRDSDLTHTPMFHQIEGLLVDKHVTMANLRGVLTAFIWAVFGPSVKIRFRPSFFPFTEPSAEVDISCVICKGKGHTKDGICRVCKGSGWVEILGCGMVDPAVFESVKYDTPNISGFAFGLGVERIAMLKFGINDLRIFFQNDIRFLNQFGRELPGSWI